MALSQSSCATSGTTGQVHWEWGWGGGCVADVGVQGGCFLPLGLLRILSSFWLTTLGMSCLLSLPFCTESTGADYEFRVEAYYLRISLACGRSWAPPLSKKGKRMKLWILLGSLSNKVKFCTEDRGSRRGERKEKGLEQEKKNTKKLEKQLSS